MDPTLVTITLSHYCEKARWGLDRAAIAYEERRHAPAFHVLPVRRLSGKTGTPILVTSTGVIVESTNILLWADEQATPGRKLYPTDAASREEVLALREEFDQNLGPHVRRVAYFHLLPETRLMRSLWTYAAPRHQQLLMPLLFRPLRRLARSAMRIDAAGAERSLVKLRAVIESVNDRLRDGRRHLVGECLTAADITFASLAAPILWPEGYSVPLPPLESIPGELAQRVQELRETPAGAFGLRLYREERHWPRDDSPRR